MTHAEIIATYHQHSAATLYALGFVYKRTLYVIFLTWEQLAAFFKADKASSKRGGWNKIRIRLHTADRKALIEMGAEPLGADTELKADAKHNTGENFERLVTERYTSQTWVKDSVPFWVAGDIEINGTQVQVKFDGAELTNEKTLINMLAV